MRAVILAAGVGRRMQTDGPLLPKVMLPFGGATLLRRHIEILRHLGVGEIVVAVGHRADLIESEIAALGGEVETVFNPWYEEGSIITLWTAGEAMTRGGDVVLMDADVLYDQRMMARLLGSAHRNCFLLDRDFEVGEEPTKLCVRDGHLVEFHKTVRVAYDFWGESVGFFRIEEDIARRMLRRARAYIEAGRRHELYDEALRDILLGDPPGTFGFEDVTGLPWTEIDFPEDVERAANIVLPRLAPLPAAAAGLGQVTA